jgi:hypothetical protein
VKRDDKIIEYSMIFTSGVIIFTSGVPGQLLLTIFHYRQIIIENNNNNVISYNYIELVLLSYQPYHYLIKKCVILYSTKWCG